MHRIGRERDASVYRAFTQYVEQGDRFVEAIPITKKSRHVLSHTLPGLALARILMILEPKSGQQLTKPDVVRGLIDTGEYDLASEIEMIAKALEIQGELDVNLMNDLKAWFEQWEHNLRHPNRDRKKSLLPHQTPDGRQPMQSLRDVETDSKIFGWRV